jgi:hypothetical protein
VPVALAACGRFPAYLRIAWQDFVDDSVNGCCGGEMVQFVAPFLSGAATLVNYSVRCFPQTDLAMKGAVRRLKQCPSQCRLVGGVELAVILPLLPKKLRGLVRPDVRKVPRQRASAASAGSSTDSVNSSVLYLQCATRSRSIRPSSWQRRPRCNECVSRVEWSIPSTGDTQSKRPSASPAHRARPKHKVR